MFTWTINHCDNQIRYCWKRPKFKYINWNPVIQHGESRYYHHEALKFDEGKVAREPFERSYCAGCPGRDHGFCSRLPEPLRERLREAVRPAAPERLPGENGGRSTGWDLAIVARGTLAVRSTFEDGRRAITDFMVPGEVLHGNAGKHRRGREITASSDFLLCLVPSLEAEFGPADRQCLERYIRTDAVNHIDELRDTAAALARLAPRERIAHLLLGLRERLNPDGRTIDLPFSRSDIADLLGMRAETVSRSLLALEQSDLIRRNGPKKIDILDSAGLAAVAGG